MFKATGTFISLLFAARVAVAQTVVAHYMAQQLYSYEDQDISTEIELAKSLGIDGFVLNIAHMDYEVDKIQNVVYPAAERLGFKLLYSIDTGYDWTPADIASLVAATAKSDATYLWDGKPLISSFSPSREGYGNQFWQDVKSGLQAQGVDVVLAPALIHTGAEQLKSDFPSADGIMNWWAWPSDTANNLTTTQDIDYKAVADERGGPFIMGVSPWQFKDWQTQSWIQNSDYLYDYRWKQAIQDIIDVNPIIHLDDDIAKYAAGVDHSGWGLMSKYYISWYKSCMSAGGARKAKRSQVFPRITRPEYRDYRGHKCEPAETKTVTVTVSAGETPSTSTTVPSSSSASSSSEVPASTQSPSSTEAPVSTQTPISSDAPVSTEVPPSTSAPVPAPTSQPIPEPVPAVGSCDSPAVEKDVLVWYFRIFPKDITCSGGTIPRNRDLVSDSIFAWVGLTSPATVRIDAGNSTGSYDLPAGPHVVGIPFPVTNNETPYFQIIRDGAQVVAGHATWSIKRDGCEFYDMNARVGVIDSVQAA